MTTSHKHLFPIVNAMVSAAMKSAEEDGECITCEKGCDHCCHLLIEISWEEGEELAEWLATQPEERRRVVEERIERNAANARELFVSSPESAPFASTVRGDDFDLPEDIYDDYFYDAVRPCPFLEEGSCITYEARPTSCRLHMVSSEPQLCSREAGDAEDYQIPDAVESLKEEAAPAITSVELDGRWGHFATVVHSVIEEWRESGRYPS